MKTCSHCARSNDDSRLNCAGCGERLPELAASNATVAPATGNASREPLVGEKLDVDTEVFTQNYSAATPRVWVTYWLLGLNSLVFLTTGLAGANLVHPQLGTLLDWGANWGPLTTTSGGEWRLLANCFLHFTLWHLLGNMFALWQGGRLTERLFGNGFFLVLYLATGVIGSLTALDWHPDIISAGASGAVFGIYGALLGYLVRQRGAVPKRLWRSLGKTIVVFVAFNLFYGLTQLKVDNAAHEGGLAAGLMLGWLAARPLHLPHRSASTHRTALHLALGLVVLLLPLAWLFPRDRPTYGKLLSDMGTSFDLGSGVPKSREAALRWYHQAAQLGSTEAEMNLGRVYFNDDPPGTKNPTAGIHWFREAAAHGSTEAEATLGAIYYDGVGVAADHVAAREWIARAAAHGQAKEQMLLGAMYYRGDGTTRDYAAAFHWIRQAAGQGLGPAQALLSVLYYQGQGTETNLAAAAHWALAAAKNGQVKAQFELGSLYAQGQGVAQDAVEAYAWLGVAISNRVEVTATAKKLQEQLALNMTPEQLAKAHRRFAELVRQLPPTEAGQAGQ